jgi:hypothetical protein
VPCKAVEGGKTPFEVCHGGKPAIHHLKTSCRNVYVMNTKPNMKKVGGQGEKNRVCWLQAQQQGLQGI